MRRRAYEKVYLDWFFEYTVICQSMPGVCGKMWRICVFESNAFHPNLKSFNANNNNF